MPPGISTHDQKIIKRKIEKTKCKVDNVEKELTDQRELFSACYVSNSQQLKRGQKQQAKWHESRVEELERLKGHLQSFYDSIRNADTFMSDLWHGIDKELQFCRCLELTNQRKKLTESVLKNVLYIGCILPATE